MTDFIDIMRSVGETGFCQEIIEFEMNLICQGVSPNSINYLKWPQNRNSCEL